MEIEGFIIANLMFYGRQAMHLSKEHIDPNDLLSHLYRDAYSYMLEIYNNGGDWDMPLIALKYQDSESLSCTRLCSLFEHSLTSLELLPFHIIQLKRRNLEMELQTAIKENLNYSDIKDKILELENTKHEQELALSSTQAIQTALTELQKQCNEPIDLETGYYKLDNDLGGLHRSDLVIIGGRTSQGKTAFSLNIALNVASKLKRVLLINGEMSSNQLVSRLLCAKGDFDSSKIRNRTMSDKDWETIAGIGSKLAKYLINFYCRGNLNSELINKLTKKYKPDVLIVDYLQLINDSSGKENRAQHLANIARNLKNIAMENNVCLIALSQLNRETENQITPMLSNIKESGGIEEAADVVFLLWSENDKELNKEITRVKIAKNRHGKSNVVYSFDFIKETQNIIQL